MPSRSISLAAVGTMQLEFTRLAQLTKNDKYFDAVERIMLALEKWQDHTLIPGMWPTNLDVSGFDEEITIRSTHASSELYTLGASADSAYEYLPKQFMMLGGLSPMYQTMYERFIEQAKKYLFFRPMTIENREILLSGSVRAIAHMEAVLEPRMEHLTCFAGGMLAVAGKIFNRAQDLVDSRRITDGCVWAYRSTATGIMPETFTAVPCPGGTAAPCPWNETLWHLQAADGRMLDPYSMLEYVNSERLPPGFAAVRDRRYLLRPEAIESVFIQWRVTHEPYWREVGWDMFTAIRGRCETELAHGSLDDVTKIAPRRQDEMESFWLAETLKYFYLLFCEDDVVSLDEYVLNTEAHPLKRPRA